jgi:predicted methyltransferase
MRRVFAVQWSAPKITFAAFVLACAALLAACVSMTASPDYAAIVAAPDRSEADRKTDERRKPEQLLAFIGVRPGMKVLDVGAGAGYSTELLARAVGPQGVVYAQNSKDVIERVVKDKFDLRAKAPAMRNVVRVIRDPEDPVPPDARDLDLVTYLYEYHEAPNINVDRPKMIRRFFDALKPGGILVIADHSARTGDGLSVTRSLHRIEESIVRRDIESVGFKFVAEGGFLRNPEDKRDISVFKLAVPADDFVLKFEKP